METYTGRISEVGFSKDDTAVSDRKGRFYIDLTKLSYRELDSLRSILESEVQFRKPEAGAAHGR
ncbi:hypothetical protein [Endozoicomonas sp. ALC066]|uniref:hypothetical protein n=1 Tax=Endozoicomonas sp. ALC066 TaxID=3403078 RepID=UPI003BB51D74